MHTAAYTYTVRVQSRISSIRPTHGLQRTRTDRTCATALARQVVVVVVVVIAVTPAAANTTDFSLVRCTISTCTLPLTPLSLSLKYRVHYLYHCFDQMPIVTAQRAAATAWFRQRHSVHERNIYVYYNILSALGDQTNFLYTIENIIAVFFIILERIRCTRIKITKGRSNLWLKSFKIEADIMYIMSNCIYRLGIG